LELAHSCLNPSARFWIGSDDRPEVVLHCEEEIICGEFELSKLFAGDLVVCDSGEKLLVISLKEAFSEKSEAFLNFLERLCLGGFALEGGSVTLIQSLVLEAESAVLALKFFDLLP